MATTKRTTKSKPKTAAAPSRRRIEVRRSRVQGRGVFACRAIKAGQRVVEYKGERITPKEAERRYDDEAMARHHTFMFVLDRRTIIDAVQKGNEARYINHSCDPNCVAAIMDKRIWIYAIRDIAPGDELFYDYWYVTDPKYTVRELQQLYPCRCGAASCRGTLAAVPEKPEKPARSAKKKSKKKGSAGRRGRAAA